MSSSDAAEPAFFFEGVECVPPSRATVPTVGRAAESQRCSPGAAGVVLLRAAAAAVRRASHPLLLPTALLARRKVLEIDFVLREGDTRGLRALTRATIDELCTAAKCAE